MEKQPKLELPSECYYWNEVTGEIIKLKKDVSGFFPMQDQRQFNDICIKHNLTKMQLVMELNSTLNPPVNIQQMCAMHHGSMFGWETGGSNPNNYNTDGTYTKKFLNKTKKRVEKTTKQIKQVIREERMGKKEGK